jgi:hypothetical protein
MPGVKRERMAMIPPERGDTAVPVSFKMRGNNYKDPLGTNRGSRASARRVPRNATPIASGRRAGMARNNAWSNGWSGRRVGAQVGDVVTYFERYVRPTRKDEVRSRVRRPDELVAVLHATKPDTEDSRGVWQHIGNRVLIEGKDGNDGNGVDR